MKRRETSASDSPPTRPWTTIQAQATSPTARRTTRSGAGTVDPPLLGRRRLGANVADEDEHERQGHGAGGAGEVDGQRQAALEGRVRAWAATLAGTPGGESQPDQSARGAHRRRDRSSP